MWYTTIMSVLTTALVIDTGVCVKPHHAAVSARISQRQPELSGPARVHAELQAQSLAACSGETQGPNTGMAHRNTD